MKKKIIYTSLITGAILICFVFFKVNSDISPYKFLQKKVGKHTATSVNEFLYQTNIADREYVIFYINGNNTVSCAIIKKNFFTSSILLISSEVLLVNANSKTDYLFSSYDNGNKWIDWGIIRDDNIKQVLINDKKSTMSKIDKYDIRICYLIGDSNESILPPNHQEIY